MGFRIAKVVLGHDRFWFEVSRFVERRWFGGQWVLIDTFDTEDEAVALVKEIAKYPYTERVRDYDDAGREEVTCW